MDGGAVVSTKTSPRRAAAIKQRQFLKNECGYTDRDIQVFAQIFNTDPERDDPRFGCAADQTEEDQ